MTKKTVYPPWMVLHLPHDADCIPGEVRDQFILSDEDLARELLCMTDHQTADLFVAGLASGVARAPVSRLVVDVERFEFDAKEPMAERGMGAVYTRTSTQAPLRRALAVAERERLLEVYYRPHHLDLPRLVNDALTDHAKAIVLDAHSFPSLPLPYERWKGRRPDICIGTDAFVSEPTRFTRLHHCATPSWRPSRERASTWRWTYPSPERSCRHGTTGPIRACRR